MRITALEPQVNNPERVNIFVDGRFLLGASAAIVLQMGLHVEEEISREQIEQLHNEEAEQQSDDRAYNFLYYRTRSR
jgi:regulatory protein